MKCLKIVVGVASVLLASTNVHAGEFSAKLGALAAFSPDYQGSDDYQFGGLPYVSLGWKADTVVPKGGTGLQLGLHDASLEFPRGIDFGLAKLYRPEGLYRANLGFAYNMGRDEDDNTALNGMGEIGGHALATVGLSFKPNESGWGYAISYTGDLSNETDGATVDGKISYAYPLSKQVMVSVTGDLVWANQDHMQSYFGVSTAQAVSSSNARFDADSGIKSAGLGVSANWMISENWMAISNLKYQRLMNDAADSPLVTDQGSADQVSASVGLIYAF